MPALQGCKVQCALCPIDQLMLGSHIRVDPLSPQLPEIPSNVPSMEQGLHIRTSQPLSALPLSRT